MSGKFSTILAGSLIVVLGGCYLGNLPPRTLKQVEITSGEVETWFHVLPRLSGIKYELGGNKTR
jgi:hypothetical protein